jgi:hypothetical protein
VLLSGVVSCHECLTCSDNLSLVAISHSVFIPLSLSPLPLSLYLYATLSYCLSVSPSSSSLSCTVPRHDAPDRAQAQRQTTEGENRKEGGSVGDTDRVHPPAHPPIHPSTHTPVSHIAIGGAVADTSGVHPSMHASISHIATELLGVLRTLQSRYGTMYFDLTSPFPHLSSTRCNFISCLCVTQARPRCTIARCCQHD